MELLITYYFLSFIYCLLMQIRRWNKDAMTGGLGITPGLDILSLVIMCWALAPVDIFLRWLRVYKEAEEARRRNADTDNSLDGIK